MVLSLNFIQEKKGTLKFLFKPAKAPSSKLNTIYAKEDFSNDLIPTLFKRSTDSFYTIDGKTFFTRTFAQLVHQSYLKEHFSHQA